MKEITNGLIKDFYRRKTDKMKLRHKIRQWWRDDVWLVKAFLFNQLIAAVVGGAIGALIILAVLMLCY